MAFASERERRIPQRGEDPAGVDFVSGDIAMQINHALDEKLTWRKIDRSPTLHPNRFECPTNGHIVGSHLVAHASEGRTKDCINIPRIFFLELPPKLCRLRAL